MKFSFIVPIYKKSPEQLRRCLKSLYDQSYKDIEVICVFDGPDPELEKVADEFPEARKTTIAHGGAPKARNAGKALATGRFLSFWDADCYAEPEMTAMWERTLRENLDCDFVYSGYAWTDPDLPGYESEPFDPWLLTQYNYIASMFPIAKDKCPDWDEELEGLQDWDFWRRVVEQGCKGVYLEGYGFITDPPKPGDISSDTVNTAKRIAAVRDRRGDLDSDFLVSSVYHKRECVTAAKKLGADYVSNPFYLVRSYQSALFLGFYPKNLELLGLLLNTVDRKAKRGIYWMGMDAEQFYTAPYWQVRQLLRDLSEQVQLHLCNDARTLRILGDMGLAAQLIPLPHEPEMSDLSMPDQFRVLVLSDDKHDAAINDIIRALPDISFTKVTDGARYNIMDYTVSLQYTNNLRLDMNSQNFLIKGRHLISNVNEPYAGYTPLTENATAFRNSLINKIRFLQSNPTLNEEARQYYLKRSDPETFRDKITEVFR